MGFEANQKQVRLLLSNAVYEIPRNQRRYVWTKANWQALYDDICFVVNTPQYNKDHFIGSVVLQNNGSKDNVDHYTIIDGQQRIITISLFLAAIMQILKDLKLQKDFNGMKKFLISTNIKDEDECIINSDFHLSISRFIEEICDWGNQYESLKSQLNKIIIETKVDKPILDCLLFYYDVLRGLPKEDVLRIRDGIIKTNYIDIKAESDEDSYTIFEILNARGQPLEDHELLKNYIMRYTTPQKKKNIDAVKTDWENIIDRSLGKNAKRFFKHYATHRFNLSNRSKIYEEIKRNSRPADVNLLLSDILLKARYYKKILNPCEKGEDKNCNSVEYEVLNFFNVKKAEQFRPVILSLLHQKEENRIAEQHYNDYMKYIYNFFICYNVIGEDKSNKLEDVIYKYAPILENNYNEQNIKSFMDSLFKRLPNVDVFTKNLMTLGWSNHTQFYSEQKNKERVKLVLETIEKYVSRRTEIGDFSIEHILPDAENEANALIGNLLPLEEELNNKCDNKTITEKIPYYKKSNFAITRGFAERYEKENVFSIESRGKYLAKMLYEQILKF